MTSDNKVIFGSVCWFRGGYGFLKPDDGGEDIFVHYSDIVMPGEGMYRTLQKGQRISYEQGLNIRGEVKAINVQVIKTDVK